MAEDLVAQQQYIDFLTNRRFRSSLLCRAEIILDRAIARERMTGFQIAGLVAPCTTNADKSSDAREVFQTPEGGGIATNNPVFKAALTCLAERAPDRFTFDELCVATRNRLAGTAAAQPIPEGQLPWFVAEMLCQSALARLFDLHVCRPSATPGVGANAPAPMQTTSIRTK
jgi:hypothetical protein